MKLSSDKFSTLLDLISSTVEEFKKEQNLSNEEQKCVDNLHDKAMNAILFAHSPEEESYSLKYGNGTIYWFSKEPLELGYSDIKFKDGEIADYQKYLHRKGGPAIEKANGDKYWHLYGQRHREDGPAIEWCNGTKHYYINGKRHRENGPAIEYSDGEKHWYWHGKDVKVSSQEEFERWKNLKISDEKL